MKLYDQNGYVNISWIRSLGLPFNLLCGGRGTGKTYGGIKEADESGSKFIFMRRTDRILETIRTPELSPFKKYNSDTGRNLGFARSGRIDAIYNFEPDGDGKLRPAGPVLGYLLALSTISNIRGFDASDVDLWIYDEFIKEDHQPDLRGEGKAFLNAYETINRNRELSGEKPVQLFGFSNSNKLDNPIFIELGLVQRAEKMQRNGTEIHIDRERGIGLFMLQHSPISAQKEDTALYKLTGDSEFSRMALGNEFKEISDLSIGNRPLVEFKPVVGIGEITIYKHKSKPEYYVTSHRSGDPPVFGMSQTERSRFFRVYNYLWTSYMKNKITFETSTDEILFQRAFD